MSMTTPFDLAARAAAATSLLALLVAAPCFAADTPKAAQDAGPRNGSALFQEKCAMCHGPGGMGTGLLARRLGKDFALLENRGLVPAYVTLAVRSGIGNMPAMSRVEVSDAQLAAISAYLRKEP